MIEGAENSGFYMFTEQSRWVCEGMVAVLLVEGLEVGSVGHGGEAGRRGRCWGCWSALIVDPKGRSEGYCPYGMSYEELRGEGVRLCDESFGCGIDPLVAKDA